MDYAKLATKATKILTKFGASATLGQGLAAVSVQAVRNRIIDHSFEDSQVQVGDVEFVVEAAAAPKRGMRFVHGGDSYILVKVEPIKPATTVVVWLVYGRVG